MQFYLHVLIPSVPLIPLLHQFPPSPMTGCPSHPPLLPPFFYMSGGSVGPLLSSTYGRIAQLGSQTSRMGYSQDRMTKMSGWKMQRNPPAATLTGGTATQTLPDRLKDGKMWADRQAKQATSRSHEPKVRRTADKYRLLLGLPRYCKWAVKDTRKDGGLQISPELQ